jgi:hypothetical protein
MADNKPPDDGPPHSGFSPELTHDIGVALSDYLRTSEPAASAVLQSLTNRVCTEAKALGLPPEKMLIEIKRLFERHPLADVPLSERRQKTFERFVSGCIKSYFGADEPE